MIRINLLPVRAEKKKKLAKRQIHLAGLSLIFLFLLIAAVHYYKTSEIKGLKMSIENKERDLSLLKTKTGELTKVRDENKMISQRLDVVKQLESNRTGPVRLLEEISRAISEKAWINKLSDSENTLLLTGSASSDEDISEFMKNLEKMNGINRVELEVAEMSEKGGVKVKSFSIKMDKIVKALQKI
ncbi:MAG: PilN domain-containing protein [Deltaproteobacteria bacterium]|nr:PilN domain-containing protein [Deltaproteobacteria bacterium]